MTGKEEYIEELKEDMTTGNEFPQNILKDKKIIVVSRIADWQIQEHLHVDYNRECKCGIDHLHPILLKNGLMRFWCGECGKYWMEE